MIYYGTPYSVEKRLGRAYNQFMRMLPEPTDFGCLMDADAVFTTHDFGHLIQRVVSKNPSCRLFYARTNRVKCPWQRLKGAAGDDMRRHRAYGAEVATKRGSAVRRVHRKRVPGSGFLILLRKDLWNEFQFKESGIVGVDWEFFRRVVRHGEPVLQMLGVYLYHWYRGGKARDTSHLR
jgi:hypothetical protein